MIDVETLLEPWALRPAAVTRAEVGTMSETLLVQTDTARVVLRGHRQPEAALVNFELDVMDAARDAGVPVPAVIRTTSGDRLVKTHGKWWSLQEWVDGAQPPRGHHTHEQGRSIGAMLAKVHDALRDVDAPPIPEALVEGPARIIERADRLIGLLEAMPNTSDDDQGALNWVRAQRAWLESSGGAAPEAADDTQTIHGDYHDANLIFRGPAVVAVLDWERPRPGSPTEECVRAMHLSFRLSAERCQSFLDGYRRHRELAAEELDEAAVRYGHHRDRSLWLFQELYLGGNERLRPLLNTQPFVPFQESWAGLRHVLH